MKISENVPLKNLTTMRTAGVARYVTDIFSREDARAAAKFAREKSLPWFVLSGGSNVLADNFQGVVIRNKIRGFSRMSDAIYRVGAGENLDATIAKFCEKGLSGLEFLSAIPGLIGAAPVQNVGAYGSDISATLESLTVYDAAADCFEKFAKSDCKFAYRDSIFKARNDRKYIICDVTFALSHELPQPPFYASLQKYLIAQHPELSDDGKNFREKVTFSPSEIRSAITEIRAQKLPDPREIPSAGSFFKNPLVDAKFAHDFLAKNPTAPHWRISENCEKLAAGWLIDHSGLRGFNRYGFEIFSKNALVITNLEPGNSRENLHKFRDEIVDIVREKFGVTLEQEPENL